MSPLACVDRVLIVEDLDEPRRWLAELVPTVLPGILQVDTAASVAEARSLIGAHAYRLSFIDWALPDGTGEVLIRALVAARPEALVIVTTIHDDDAYVFPALRAGATGYILKSQPREVVAMQIRRIEQGEPALSPSVATRILKHFQSGAAPQPAAEAGVALTRREVQVLQLIAKGYNVPEVGRLLDIAASTVSGYVRDIYRKLDISSRAEAAMEAVRRGLIE
ncbi:LuxR C-terminal-related transcriptional regulator [Variovorax terrae]|uniref:Response regulator transcription factor n=1 Tax=Variovorax terrae TaxID=2923278 RepID=A0A9X2APA1_9BURK|nr:response regulator transcription factor [Variovorax terrae]MCJ0765603.1 response regulator transcription factor [Variovorax terrae]